MYLCKECKNTFEEPLVVKDSHELPGGFFEEVLFCPLCGGDDFEPAVRCEKCSRFIPESQNVFGLCRECEQEADRKWGYIQNIARLIFDQNERNYLNWKAEEL